MVEKEWLTGGESLQKLGLSAKAEILKCVCKGLQPYDENMGVIRPPGVDESYRRILELQEELWDFHHRFPGFEERDMTFEEHWISNHDRKIDETGRLKKVYYQDGSDSAIREEYQSIKVKTQMLEKELLKYPHLPKWIGYECPSKDKDRKRVISLLIDSYYKPADILEFEKGQPTREIKVKDPEAFIRSLSISFESDTEVNIQVAKTKSKPYSHDSLGFKRENTKEWLTLIGILKSQGYTYNIGKAHGTVSTAVEIEGQIRKIDNKMQRKEYGAEQKIKSSISKKFVLFLNKTYDLQLDDNYQIFELVKNDKAGTYKLKFNVSSPRIADPPRYEDFSKDALIEEIECLSACIAGLKASGEPGNDPNQVEAKLDAALTMAEKKKYLGPNRIEAYRNPTT